MNDDRRKLLCKMTGQVWHECIWGKIIPWHDFQTKTLLSCSCGRDDCNESHFNHNPTFTTPDDQHAVMQAICKAGKWSSFYRWSWMNGGGISGGNNYEERHVKWLFSDPSRFCDLAAEWAETLTDKWWIA